MTRDPLSGDPLGLNPIEHVQEIKQSKLQRGIEAYRNNILLRGMHLIDPRQKVAPAIGDDGEELTLEKRREIAAKRKAFKPEVAFLKRVEVDGVVRYLKPDGTEATADEIAAYNQDLKDHEVEPLGASAEKIIQQQPEMQIVVPKELPLVPPQDQAEEPTSEDLDA